MAIILKNLLRFHVVVFVASVILSVSTPSNTQSQFSEQQRRRRRRQQQQHRSSNWLSRRDASDSHSPKMVWPQENLDAQTLRRKAASVRKRRDLYEWAGPGLPARQDDFDFSKGKCSVYDAVCECTNQLGQTGEPVDAVVGGNETRPHAVPWIFEIWTSDGRICMGFLISYYFGLTSGNCLVGVRYINISLGVFDFEKEEGGIKMTIYDNKFFIHRKFEVSYDPDNIALIQIADEVNERVAIVHPNIKPACLGTQRPARYEICFGAGWGVTDDDKDIVAARLQWIRLRVFSGCCGFLHMYSVNEKDPSGPCHGDQGSPLMCTGRDGVTRVYGILKDVPEGCDSREGTGGFISYVNTLDQLAWIKKLTDRKLAKLYKRQDNFFII